jgi:hypothetical protein
VIALALALALQGQDMVGPPPPLYRWKDRQGQVHVTTATPPLGVVVIETVLHADGAAARAPYPTHEEQRASIESVMKAETIAYWHGIDESFSKAYASMDAMGQTRVLDNVFASALLGNGLWAMPLIPALLVSICALLAWQASVGRSVRAQSAIWAGAAVSCLMLSHTAIQVAIHGPQARRLDFALSMLPIYLGGYTEIGPEDGRAIADHIAALADASAPMSPIWAFPLEIYRARRTLAGLLRKVDVPEPEEQDSNRSS